jgi:hypothetical protein
MIGGRSEPTVGRYSGHRFSGGMVAIGCSDAQNRSSLEEAGSSVAFPLGISGARRDRRSRRAAFSLCRTRRETWPPGLQSAGGDQQYSSKSCFEGKGQRRDRA